MWSAGRRLHTLRAGGECANSTRYLCRCSRKEEFASLQYTVRSHAWWNKRDQWKAAVTQQAAAPAEAFTPWAAACPPRTRVNLRRPGESQIQARSSNSIEFLVETQDFAGRRAVLL